MRRRQLLAWAAAAVGLIEPALAGAPGEPAYEDLVLLRPRADEVTGSSATVQVALEPVLRVHAEHRLRVQLNGQILPGVWVQDEFTLRGLPAGRHRLQVLVTEPGGSVLARSQTVSFRVRR